MKKDTSPNNPSLKNLNKYKKKFKNLLTNCELCLPEFGQNEFWFFVF